MSFLARQLPETIETRFEALALARNKRDSLPPGTNPLSAATSMRLDTMSTDYTAKMTAIATSKAPYNAGTPVKNTAGETLRLSTGHFIQVFNLGVARGKYPAAHRSYYNLPVDSSALPDLTKDSDLLLWGNYLVGGDALRVAAGGAAMANPEIMEVDIAKTSFSTLFTAQSTNKDALDVAQESLEAILDETDKVIKKVWDELETFYNEETDESRRENCREWGVVYVTTGNEKTMSGTITYNAAPGADLYVHFKNGKKAVQANAAGEYSITTRLMGSQKVVVEKREDTTVVKEWEFDVTLSESGDKTENFTVND